MELNSPLRRSGYQTCHVAVRIRHHFARAIEQPFFEVRLVTDRVGAAHHCVMRLERQTVESAAPQKGPQFRDEEIGVLAPGKQPDAPRIVYILIKDGFHPRVRQFLGQIRRIVGAAECEQLHEQTAVGRLLNAAAHSALFADIKWFHHSSVTVGATVWQR